MKIFLLITIFCMKAYAVDYEACNSSGELGLKKCLKEVAASTRSFGKAPWTCSPQSAERASHNSPDYPPLTNAFNRDGARCESFISNQSNIGFGPYGMVIIEYLNQENSSSVFFNQNLPGMTEGISACPNWSNMNLEEKKHFWVWVMASIAHVESKCIAHVRNTNGTNGVAAGFYQIDERPSNRSWRGPNCGVSNILDPKSNIRCGLDIMKELLSGTQGSYKTNGELWGTKSRSYWEHLRKKNGGKIAQLIKEHPHCSRTY